VPILAAASYNFSFAIAACLSVIASHLAVSLSATGQSIIASPSDFG